VLRALSKILEAEVAAVVDGVAERGRSTTNRKNLSVGQLSQLVWYSNTERTTSYIAIASHSPRSSLPHRGSVNCMCIL